MNVSRIWGTRPILFPSRLLRKAVINAHKRLLRYKKSAKRFAPQHVPIDEIDLNTTAPTPEQAILTAEYLSRLKHCLRALNPDLLKTLLLKALESSLEDIAKATEVPEGTVKSRIHTARKQVDNCMKRAPQFDRWMPVMNHWENHIQEAFAQDQQEGVTSHLDERQLFGLATGKISDEQSVPLLEHLIVCPSCARYLKRIQAALRERETLGPVPTPRAWQGPLLGLAAGLILGFGAFFGLQRQPEPLQNPLRLELSADSAVRSKDPIVLEARDALDLQLGLLPGAAYQAYRLDLVQDGVVRRSFEQVRLEAGALSLILPAAQVPEGRFELRAIGLDGAAETTLATFTLDVRKAP